MKWIGRPVAEIWPFEIFQQGGGRHLGFVRTVNSAVRSADPENPSLERNMEWIECTVCEIFALEVYSDLETGVRVTQGHRKWQDSIVDRRLYIRIP